MRVVCFSELTNVDLGFMVQERLLQQYVMQRFQSHHTNGGIVA